MSNPSDVDSAAHGQGTQRVVDQATGRAHRDDVELPGTGGTGATPNSPHGSVS